MRVKIKNINKKIRLSDKAKHRSYPEAMVLLEQAHLLAQTLAIPHVRVHWKMLLLAYKYRDWKEFFGQIPRIILAAPGSWTGRAPKGNVGTTKMGIFEVKK